jgi:hypothetical protein
MAEFPAVELTMGKDKPIMVWWFGDLASRLAWRDWARGAWRAMHMLFGGFVLAALALLSIRRAEAKPARLWMIAGGVALLVFTNLILIHFHYYYIFSVPLALLAALAVSDLEPRLHELVRVPWHRFALVAVILGGSLVQGLAAARLNLLLDRYPTEVAAVIRQHTSVQDKLAIWGGMWSVPLFRSQREGVELATFQHIEEPDALKRLRELGYNRLVLVAQSPQLAAVGVINGRSAPPPLRTNLPPIAQAWPVVFESDAVLILEIPR